MAPPEHPATLIMWAIQTGRIKPQRARHWATLAAAGEDISVLRHLLTDERKPVVQAHSWDEAIATVSDLLSQIDRTDPNTQRRTVIEDPDEGEISQQDWIRLFGQPPSAPRARPPRAAQRADAAERMRERVRNLSDDQLYRELFEHEQ